MILLDTHTAVWLASDQSKLSEGAKNVISSHADKLHISVVSAWEISMLYKRKRLQLPIEPELYLDRMIKQHAINEVPLSRHIAQLSTRLPDIHNDPFDRILIAMCQALQTYEWSTRIPMTEDGMIVSGFWDSSRAPMPEEYELIMEGKALVKRG